MINISILTHTRGYMNFRVGCSTWGLFVCVYLRASVCNCISLLSLWISLSIHSTWEVIVLIQLEGIFLLESSMDDLSTWELLESWWLFFNLRESFLLEWSAHDIFTWWILESFLNLSCEWQLLGHEIQATEDIVLLWIWYRRTMSFRISWKSWF